MIAEIGRQLGLTTLRMRETKKILALYGADLDSDGFIVSPKGKKMGTQVTFRGARLYVKVPTGPGDLRLFSGHGPESIEEFVERFWFWEKVK